MGAEFSYLCRSVLPKPRPCGRQRVRNEPLAITDSISGEGTQRRQRPPTKHPLFDKETVVNTLKNRSPTSVGRHLALWRLARKLSSLGRMQRLRFIRFLRLSPLVLRQVRKYTPRNLFAPVPDDWKLGDSHRFQMAAGKSQPKAACSPNRAPSLEFIAAQPDWSPAPVISDQFKRCPRESPPRSGKSVSFAQYTETRLYMK